MIMKFKNIIFKKNLIILKHLHKWDMPKRILDTTNKLIDNNKASS